MDLESVVERLAEQVERRFYGKHRGFVVDNADPEELGRLRLTVPGVLGDEVVTGWASPCVPHGGAAEQGFLFVPEVGAGVWVEFEEGDLEFPIWVGTFWSKPGGESELPRPLDADAVRNPPTCGIFKTRSGHTIELDDLEGEEKIIVRSRDDHRITMSADGVVITTAEGAVVELKGQAATLVAADGVEISAGSVTLDSSSIALGAGAVEPVVLGNQLLTLFNTHTHPTSMGPSGPPMMPLTAAHMSPGVKAK